MVRNGRYMIRMTRHDTPVNEGGGNKHVQLICLSYSCRISPRIYQLLILTCKHCLLQIKSRGMLWIDFK